MTQVVVLDDQVPVTPELVKDEAGALVTAYGLLRALEESGGATETALTISGHDWDQYVALGYMIGRVTRTSAFYCGDLLLTVQNEFPEEFSQFSGVFGLAPQTLLARLFVCENVPPERRVAGVAFSAHALVARLKPEEQKKWLALAKKKGLTHAELKERMKGVRKETQPVLEGTEAGEPDAEMLLEVARAIVHDAQRDPADEAYYRIPDSLIVRLTAALGMET